MGTWQGMEATLTGDRPPLMMDASPFEHQMPPSLLVAVDSLLLMLMKILASAAVVDEDVAADGGTSDDTLLCVGMMLPSDTDFPPSDNNVAGTNRPTGLAMQLAAVTIG